MFQKKNIADIKFEGTNEEFVWRSPITDFETGSKLTVYESQEALFTSTVPAWVYSGRAATFLRRSIFRF